jgi:choline dehydrogenase-like flavoprotein
MNMFMDSSTKSTLLAGLDSELAARAGSLKPADQATYPIVRNWLNGSSVSALEFLIFPLFLDPQGGTPQANTSYVTFGLCPQHTFNRGSVHITSNDPATQPTINPKYFDFNFDKQLLVQAVKATMQFLTHDPIKSAIAVNPFDPAVWTDSYIENWVTQYTTSEFHPVGTAAVLPQNKGGVLDNRATVYGTNNLRVFDASVMPNHISAHLQATTYAIAEACADMIMGNL